MNSRALLTTAALALAAAASTTLARADTHGRWCPDDNPYKDDGFTDFKWGSANDKVPTADSEFKKGDKVAGSFKFDNDSFSMKRKFGDTTLTSLGTMLVGGFWLDDTFKVADGWTLRFAQRFKSDHPGDNTCWKEEDLKDWFPDRSKESNGQDPRYPTPELDFGKSAPTIGFDDFPIGFYFSGNTTSTFELGLVASKDTTCKLLGIVSWGFKITAKVGEDKGTFAVTKPTFSAATDDFCKTFNSFYDGAKITADGKTKAAKWTFEVDKDLSSLVSVPTPAAAPLFAAAGVFAIRRRAR